jgi:hypothetical protein
MIEEIVIGAIIGMILLTAWGVYGYPIWNVWASRKSGEAELEQAYKEQQIQIAEAESRLKAAELNKRAAVIEAEAVSLQIKAIGEQLQKHDLYLKWQWIKMMEDRHSKADTIYVPTEAGLPILEAGRR